jgi:hypothetical protein
VETARRQAEIPLGQLAGEDLKIADGNAEYLVGSLQERYGIARDAAHRQVGDFEARFARCILRGAAGIEFPSPGPASAAPWNRSKTIHLAGLRSRGIHRNTVNMKPDMRNRHEPPQREPQHLPPRRQRDPTNQDEIPARRDPERRDRPKKHVTRNANR